MAGPTQPGLAGDSPLTEKQTTPPPSAQHTGRGSPGAIGAAGGTLGPGCRVTPIIHTHRALQDPPEGTLCLYGRLICWAAPPVFAPGFQRTKYPGRGAAEGGPSQDVCRREGQGPTVHTLVTLPALSCHGLTGGNASKALPAAPGTVGNISKHQVLPGLFPAPHSGSLPATPPLPWPHKSCLHRGTAGIWGEVILRSGGCPVHCRVQRPGVRM